MRTGLWLGSVVLGLAAVFCAGHLWAESKEKKPTPRTRIGLINLTYVIKHYDKYTQFQAEVKDLVAPFQRRHEELQSKLEELRKEAANPSLVQTAGEEGDEKSKKEELEEKAKKIQREMEENKEKIQIKAGKKSDTEMKVIFMDVMEAAQIYAPAHDLDLVLHYNDAITQEDLLSAQNIARKLNTGALMPMYSRDNMDISQDIVAMLNQKTHKKK